MSPFRSEIGWVVLYPLACLWAVATRMRRQSRWGTLRRVNTRAKTVVVGNLHSGGSGKTPLVAAIAENFSHLSPAIVSRGYKAALSNAGARVLSGASEGPRLFGDEPWMLSERLGIPVFIGKKRGAALLRAEAEAAPGLLLLDDAFQNRSFRHDLDIVAIQADRPLSEANCLPLGDLREPLSAVRAASAVVLVRGSNSGSAEEWRDFLKRFTTTPVFEASPIVEGIWSRGGKAALSPGLSWAAFCGIARPEAFAASLTAVVNPFFLEAFPDHYAYTATSIDRLLERKNAVGVHHLVTTEKDWHKAAPLFEARSQRLYYLRIGYVFSQEFWYFLRTHLETA